MRGSSHRRQTLEVEPVETYGTLRGGFDRLTERGSSTGRGFGDHAGREQSPLADSAEGQEGVGSAATATGSTGGVVSTGSTNGVSVTTQAGRRVRWRILPRAGGG
ncbi:MAG: hypothetical protein LBB58_01180 [Cellulomonadaceae bacterium]|nr:hypothetical protein [Cellulomonadaceae bacterium]